jgi:hypothetical protein
MITDLTRSSRGHSLLLVWWRRRQGHEGRVTRGAIVCRCSKQGVLWWLRRLLRRAHPWPHRDGAGTRIVEGGPRRGVAALALLLEPSESLILSVPFPLPLPLSPFWEWGQEGEGPPEDTVVPAAMGAEAIAAVEDAILLRAQSRTLRSVPVLLSYLARSPRVRDHCERC